MKTVFKEYGKLLWRLRWSLLVVLLSITAAVSLDIAIPLIYKNIANALTQPFSPSTLAALQDNLLYLVLMFLAMWVSWRFVEFGIIPLEAGGIRYLDRFCFETLLKQPYRFFEDNFSGSLVKQATRYTRSFESITDWFVFQLYHKLLAISAAFIIFYLQDPHFAGYFLLWVALFIAWSVGFSVWKLKFDERVANWDSKLGGAYSDSISNIGIVKGFALERRELANMTDLATQSYKSRRLSWILMFVSFSVQGLLTFSMEALIVYWMILDWQQGNFEVGQYVLFQSVILLLIRYLWDFGHSFRPFFTALADAREMAEIIQRTEVEQDSPKAQAHKITQGLIEFQKVSFSYRPATTEPELAHTALFQAFDLTIHSGEKVALVGHSGSGKTSLTKLLFRFMDPQSGVIKIDGIPAHDYTLSALREQIALVPQQPELFHRSIRDNITLGKTITEAELLEAAQQAQALDFIQALPEGFETLVGERGVKLSGGEKQRIAIARALLQRTPIVVLDEATSALDSLTEQHIQTAIFELIKDKTAIVIAHRLSTILRMDRIIVLTNGEIIEQGTHTELLAQQGHYYRMWQHQSGEFLKD